MSDAITWFKSLGDEPKTRYSRMFFHSIPELLKREQIEHLFLSMTTMRKIIFLDIDGVLNVYPQTSPQYPDGHDEYGARFHPHFERNLKWIIENTGAKIVMSSSWRHNGLIAMQEMWKFRNLPGELIDTTPFRDKHSRIRGEEIDEWVRNNIVDSYVILDDDDDMLKEQLPFFVKTSGNTDHTDFMDGGGYGLTIECANQAIKILNGV